MPTMDDYCTARCGTYWCKRKPEHRGPHRDFLSGGVLEWERASAPRYRRLNLDTLTLNP